MLISMGKIELLWLVAVGLLRLVTVVEDGFLIKARAF